MTTTTRFRNTGGGPTCWQRLACEGCGATVVARFSPDSERWPLHRCRATLGPAPFTAAERVPTPRLAFPTDIGVD